MITFVREAFKNIRQTGSLIESSDLLSRKMLSAVEFDQTLNMVELGAGTGSITRHILSKMNSESALTSFEINPVFFTKLQNLDDKRLTVVRDTVFDLSKYVKCCSVDYIISGLPFANMPKENKMLLLINCQRLLKPGGLFIQFQYSLNDQKLFKQIFGGLKTDFTLLNFPPAFVYYARKN